MGSSYMNRGLETAKKMPGSTSVRPDFANRLYLPIGKGTKLILLDDEAVQVYEHSVFIQGDKNAMKMKVTCTSPGPDPVPGKCRICNAMIKDERIARKFVAYLSCIDLSKFEIEGRQYTHTRKLVPLNSQAAKRLLTRREEFGSLKGGMFKIFRNEKTSPTVGDDWMWIKRVNRPKFFANSPRIKMIQDYFKRKGQTISEKEALKMLIAPFDYEKELEPTKKRIDFFLGYLGLGDAPKVEESESESYDYSDDDEEEETSSADASVDDDEEEEDFTDFEDEEEEAPPKPKKKAKKKKVKKGKKGKKKKKKSL